MRTFLSLDRARLYALLTLILGCYVSVSSIWAEPERLRIATDFPAFYNAGRILNEYPRGSLYNKDLQQQLYTELVSNVPPNVNLFFAYTPFLALFFAPLALMSYVTAFVCWILISLVLFTTGFRFAWASASLPKKYRTTGFLIAVSFLPFYAWCLAAGQTSAFGFFWLALAIHLEGKGRLLASGLSLAMLLYKPPLVILFIPMIIITRRWQTLAGFCLGAGILVLVSLALIGLSGVPAYFEMLGHFSRLKASGTHWTWHEVDALSLFLLFTRQRALAFVLLAILSCAVAPFLIFAWRERPDAAWAPTITWALILSPYVLMHDVTFVIWPALFMVGNTLRVSSEVGRPLRWILLALFLAPWAEIHTAQIFGFQPLTVALIAFGIYQLRTLLKTSDRGERSVQNGMYEGSSVQS
jgi:hypothetical protein